MAPSSRSRTFDTSNDGNRPWNIFPQMPSDGPATYRSKKFDEQCIRAHIKSNCNTGDECCLAVSPSEFSDEYGKTLCNRCDFRYEIEYKEAKKAMKRAREAAVMAAIKSSCKLGSCRTGSNKCNNCGPRIDNIKDTTREYYELLREASDAYLLRVYGVPREIGGEDAEKVERKGASFVKWTPFITMNNAFDCNYPALHLEMTKNNAPELLKIVFPWNHSGYTRPMFSHRLTTSVSQAFPYETDPNLGSLSNRSSVQVLRSDAEQSQRVSFARRHSSKLKEKTQSMFHRLGGSEKVKGLGASPSTMDEAKGKLLDLNDKMNEKFKSLAERSRAPKMRIG